MKNRKQKNIPQEWQQVKLGDQVKIFNGGAFNSEDASTVGIRWIKIANVGVQRIKWETKSFLPEGFLSKYLQYELKQEDIVVALTRPTLGNKLKISIIQNKDVPALLNQRVGKLIFKNSISPKFGYYFLVLDRVAYKINQLLAGSDPPNLSSNAFNFINLNLPPLPEQNRIVSVLETWDKVIEKLSKKIELKKQIKKGLMQDLLTGRKRLEGFNDKWRFIKLGDACQKIKTGKLDANAMVKNGKYRFYTCAKDFYLIDNYAFDTEALLVSGNGANVGYVHYYKGKFNAYQRTYVLYDFNENILFIKYLLDLFLKVRIKEEVREGNTPYITMDTLTDMNLKIPSNKEQQVIVNVLSAADKEIDILENKLKILKEQKRYLLNNLITGTIRTPETLSAKLTK